MNNPFKLLEMLQNGYKSTQGVPNLYFEISFIYEMEDARFKGGYTI